MAQRVRGMPTISKRLRGRLRTAVEDLANASGLVRSPRPLAFDPEFYRRRYGDLMVLKSREALVRHYKEHGRREGRVGTSEAFIGALEAARGRLPEDFVASTYRSCHRDLAAMSEDWEVAAHYLEFGRDEGRPYRVDLTAYEELHRWSSSGGTSFSDLLASHGLTDAAWLERFDLGNFVLLNADWLAGRATSRIRAIQLFIAEGVDRLAPIAIDQVFDPDFYRSTYAPPDSGVSDAALYRDWLCRGIGRAAYGSERQFLSSLIGEGTFPPAFDAAAYRARAAGGGWSPPASGRIGALAHFFEYGFAAGVTEMVGGPDAGRLYEQLADYLLRRKCPVLASQALDLAIAAGPRRASLHQQRGEVRRTLARLADSLADFEQAADALDSEVSSHIDAAEGLSESGRTGAALERLLRSAPRWNASGPWRAAAHRVLAAYFADRGEEARALYRSGTRGPADALMQNAMARIVEVLPIIDPLPVPPPKSIGGLIVLLANRDLPQCDHYRVEQKRRQLERGGWTVEIYTPAETDAFRRALDRASAAIFYRVPGYPAVLHAILYARALGLPTIYEIDDLIFDSAFYPDPFESFEGQITPEDYANLQHGVPQFRFAMSQCDIGLASTPALAEAMRPIVRSGIVHVLRNGLDERNAIYLERPWTPFSAGVVTVFYGSGTKAHNQDFSELVAPALVAALRRHPHVRLLLAGHLRLDDRFLPFAERVRRLDFTADVDAYWEVLSGVDINLAVLLRSPMSDAKSEIKWLEAAMCGVPSIVNGTRTYREILVDGEDALIVDTVSEWTEALERLIADPALRRRIGNTAREKALAGYTLDKGIRAFHAMLPPTTAKDQTSTPRFAEVPSRAKPRILLVNVYFPPQTVGGATRVLRDNVDYILDHAGDRLDLAVVAIDDGAEPPYGTRIDGYRGVPVFRIAPFLHRDMDWKPSDPEMRKIFEEALDRFAPDLVHFHCIQRLSASTVEATAARGIPYVVTVHDAWWISDHQFLIDEEGILRNPTPDPLEAIPRSGVGATASIARRRRLGRALEGAEAILTVSEAFAQLYRDAGHADVITLPNGVSRIPAVTRVPSPDGRVRLGHVGGRSAHKGVTLIEQVLRANAFANLSLTLVDHAFGADHFREEIWGETPVRIIGRAPQERIAELYANLDVLLAPSIWPESFGLVTREARQAGLWVVASDRGAIGEDVREGVDGFRVDVSTTEGLRAVLARMNDERKRFLRPPPKGDSRVRTAADQGAELLAFYETRLTRRRGTPG